MKKKILLISLFIIMTLGVCGCMSGTSYLVDENMEERIIDYLYNKYQKKFLYISQGDDVWSSKIKTYVCEDEDGREFFVKENNGDFIDNYGFIQYDESIQEKFSGVLQKECKLFVSSKSFFEGAISKSNSLEEYIKKCSVINVAIFIAENDSCSELANKLLEVASGSTISAVIYCVSSETLNDISKYTDTSNVISSESFWIEDNQLSDMSWEE